MMRLARRNWLAEDSRKSVSDTVQLERVQIHEFDKFPHVFLILDIWAIKKVDERCKIPSKYIKLLWVPGKKGRDRGSKPFFIRLFLRIFVGRDALVHSAAGHLLSSRVGFSVADDNYRTSAIILEYFLIGCYNIGIL